MCVPHLLRPRPPLLFFSNQKWVLYYKVPSKYLYQRNHYIYGNYQWTLSHFIMFFCKPPKVEKKSTGIFGNELTKSTLSLSWIQTVLCTNQPLYLKKPLFRIKTFILICTVWIFTNVILLMSAWSLKISL